MHVQTTWGSGSAVHRPRSAPSSNHHPQPCCSTFSALELLRDKLPPHNFMMITRSCDNRCSRLSLALDHIHACFSSIPEQFGRSPLKLYYPGGTSVLPQAILHNTVGIADQCSGWYSITERHVSIAAPCSQYSVPEPRKPTHFQPRGLRCLAPTLW